MDLREIKQHRGKLVGKPVVFHGKNLLEQIAHSAPKDANAFLLGRARRVLWDDPDYTAGESGEYKVFRAVQYYKV